MHRSRFATVILDSQTNDLAAAATFWSKALGCAMGENDGKYVALTTPPDQPTMAVQQVTHESRAHIDIESDDIEAEVRRLEGLGAKRVALIRTWWVMEAPTGARFCVVKPQRGALTDDNSNVWR
ncbi:MAG: VOC family protein [Myxococcota bacterium]|nr:VOC family protein [Myxococcota bacterium]